MMRCVVLLLGLFFVNLITVNDAQAQFNTGRELKYYWGTLTTQYGYFTVDANMTWNVSREGLRPAALNNFQSTGALSEVSLIYETYDNAARIEFNYILGTLRGNRNTYEYCDGAYVLQLNDCGEVPVLQHQRESVLFNDVSVIIVDAYQDVITLESKNRGSVFPPAIYDYDWLIGYLLVNQDMTFLGTKYIEGGGTDVPYTETTATNEMLWSAGRLGGSLNYYPLGYEGGWQIRGQAAYLLITAYGLAKEQTDYSGARSDIYYSGSGSGLMLDLDVIFNINKNMQMGFSRRDWDLEAKGRQRSRRILEAMDVTSLQTNFDGTMIFINYSF